VNQAAVSHGDRPGFSTNFESTIGGTQSVSNIATGGHPTKFQRREGSISIATEKSPSIMSAASLDDVPDYDGRQVKQQKRETDPKNDESNAILGTPEARRPSKGLSPILTAPPVCDVINTLGFAAADWTNDPYDISPLTMEYLDLYFAHINQATYCMLPKGLFLKWVRECHDKTPDDKMILYSLMAMGCRFSEKKESIADSKRLLQIARHAEQSSFGRFTLQLAQARLILALLNFSLGNSSEAWDYCGTAVRAVCGLKYNVEEGITEQPDLEDCEYGLNRETLAECRRRTFWSACVMDVSFLPLNLCFLVFD
jgi:Fungal specific transcription factor domain